ncbi:MAG: type II CAAX endopeptidase family protein, partial [Dehalococcoidia bacterium]
YLSHTRRATVVIGGIGKLLLLSLQGSRANILCHMSTKAMLSLNPMEASSGMAVPWTLRDATKATALVIGGIVLVVAGVQVVRLFDDPKELTGLLLFLSAMLEGTFLLAVWRFGPWRYGRSWKALGLQATFNNGATLALVVFLASVSFSVLYSLTMVLIGQEGLTPPKLPGAFMETYFQRVALFFLTVLLAPVAEEVFFRGFLLPVLAGRWGFLWGASLVSLLFSLSHMAPGLLVPVFVSGMLLAWLYRRTGSLWNCCMAHGAQNALAFSLTVSA